MKIVASGIRIESSNAREEPSSFMDSCDLVSGYACGVTFYPEWHHVVIVREKNNPKRFAILSLLSERWEDSINEQWEIVQRIKSAPTEEA